MPASSNNDSPPPNASEQSEQSHQTKARVSQAEATDEGNVFVASKIKKSAKRCLAAANLIEHRLEILAQLDYKPLFSGQKSTSAGEMFDLRIIERAADIEAIKTTLERIQQENADEYSGVVNQYTSALVATEADFALLKILILLREYATHTSRFLDFINEYQVPEELNLDFLGETNTELLSNVCMIDFSNALENATQVLAQLLLMLNCSTYGLTPKSMAEDGYVEIEPGEVVTKIISEDDNLFVQSLYDIANISRDLTFSREIVRIRDDLEPDEEYKEMIEEIFGSSFVTSANSENVAIMTPVVGSSAFSNLRTTINNQNSVRKDQVASYISAKKGAMSKLLYDEDILIPETNQAQYGTTTYDTIDPLVDEAFSGEKVLDFSKFSEVIDNFTSAFQQVVDFGKISFRLLDKAADSDGAPRDSMPIVQNEQPLSMPSITAAVYDTFNRKFASTCWNSISRSFTDWLEPEHINYNRAIAWLVIRDNPELAKEIVGAFLNDYEVGQLTAAGLPEAILDDDGNETEELTELVHVKPGTTLPVNLTGVGAQLNGKIKKLNTYFQSSVQQMSPSNVLSQHEVDYVSFPGLRVQTSVRADEVTQFFGEANYGATLSGPAGDLRLVNCMWLTYHKLTGENAEIAALDLSSVNIYMGSKIVAAEIIDSVLDVVRSLITPFAEVPAVSEGDPVFPFVHQMKNPYGTLSGYWGYSGAGYESLSMSSWVNTIGEFNKLFARSNDKKTYMRRQELKAVAHKITEVFSWMMEPYDFLSLRSETMIDTNSAIELPNNDNPIGVYIKSRTKDLEKYVFVTPICAAIKYEPNASVPLSWNSRNAKTNASRHSAIETHIEAMSSILTDLLEASFDSFEDDIDEITDSLPLPPGAAVDMNRRAATIPVLNTYASFLQSTKREDIMLSFQYDFLEKYAKRVTDYKQATMDLVEGEGSPLGEFVTSVRNLGDAGTDILQNLSVNQLALKQVALEEERADEENAYLPSVSVISEGEINSIKTLCEQNILKSPEGNTTRAIAVGIPLNTFDQNEISNDFCIRVSYRDIEYPQIVFRSKSYKFDKDLYLLPQDLDTAQESSTFNSLLDSTTFSRIRVEVKESNDMTASIHLLDSIDKIDSEADERSTNRDIFSNLLISEIMKLYYRVMLGVNFSEVSFLSTSEELVIPISDASASLAESMAGNIANLTDLSTNLGNNVQDLIAGVTQMLNPDEFIPGQITPVDESLIKNLRNAYQSRLLSPELLRNRTLAAKMFDRIYMIPVDPDEFYVVPPGQPQIGQGSMNPQGVVTSPEIFDYYLNAGIIEETGLDAPNAYKLAPRRTAEGSMAFGSITVSLTTVDDEAEGVLGL